MTTHRGPQTYVTPALAVDVAALTVLPKEAPGGLRRLGVVVVRPDGEDGWRLPGAFVHAPARWADAGRNVGPSPADEVPPLRAAVNRALRKAGLRERLPEQLHVFDAPDRDDRGWVISVAHRDTLPRREIPGAGVEVGQGHGHQVAVAVVKGEDDDVKAFLDGVPLRLPYDHAHVLAVAVADLRARYAVEPDPGHLLGEYFSVRELRRVHEAVKGEELQADTFRRHFEHTFTMTEQWAPRSVGRPAYLAQRLPRERWGRPRGDRPLRTAAARAAKLDSRD
ncbi:NrtR DNA-binding winged helix domain-containing protein [Quadrisphaera sp. KR29]|uniref:NrtR DNA-binding winged helix domain-containing protein n=1 Tax=Quadrisphaera sp. KR29 TaxID=3461391 RepID=UPI0040444159